MPRREMEELIEKIKENAEEVDTQVATARDTIDILEDISKDEDVRDVLQDTDEKLHKAQKKLSTILAEVR